MYSTFLAEWTDHPDVRNALHVDQNSNFFSGDNGVGMTYHLTEKSLLPFYRHIIANSPLKVMIYNGDTGTFIYIVKIKLMCF